LFGFYIKKSDWNETKWAGYQPSTCEDVYPCGYELVDVWWWAMSGESCEYVFVCGGFGATALSWIWFAVKDVR
jgi:hypothetical protein